MQKRIENEEKITFHQCSKAKTESQAFCCGEKQLSREGDGSREALTLLFTLKIAQATSSLRRICSYLAYLKNLLLDRSSGVLSGEYETWLLIYEASAKLYCRHSVVREE